MYCWQLRLLLKYDDGIAMIMAENKKAWSGLEKQQAGLQGCKHAAEDLLLGKEGNKDPLL